MKKTIIKIYFSLHKAIILSFVIACFYTLPSFSQETSNVQMAIESIKESIVAGKTRNSMTMNDALKTSNELLLAEQESNPNKNIKDALLHIQSAISYAIGSRHDHSIVEAEKALNILKRHQ